jgi:hypothetical protein
MSGARFAVLALALGGCAAGAMRQATSPVAGALPPREEIAALATANAARMERLGLASVDRGEAIAAPGGASGIPSARTAASPGDRCREVGAIADEICRAADRICVLAAELDEPPAHHRCDGARQDCRRARSVAGECR